MKDVIEYAPVFTNGADTFIVLGNGYFTKTKEDAETMGLTTAKILRFEYIEVVEITNREIYHHVGAMSTMQLGYLSGQLFDAAEIRSKIGQ